ncbi:hypothetical protein TrRE_jg13464 [Triparma retinervis]|uniref:RRM domain-containing protein n=1 Tax=Triparma retinervis TaxID=2557542 RepID=A0A9W7DPK0_9STRA|nr:hypothetical protein TrRE_jg13464 [Triparma retinervis]
MSNLPQRTLYLNNLNSSIKKPLMQKAIKTLFSSHGQVIAVDIVRTKHLRGQAWVTLGTQAEATEAMSKLQGFMLFDKPVRCQYAKESNDRVSKSEGTFVPKDVKEKRDKKRRERLEKEAAAAEETAKRQKAEEPATGETLGDPNAPPSARLFCPSLPLECTAEMLSVLFSPYPGFVRASLPRSGVGFVEYLDENQATEAKKALDGFKLTPTDSLSLFYGK